MNEFGVAFGVAGAVYCVFLLRVRPRGKAKQEGTPERILYDTLTKLLPWLAAFFFVMAVLALLGYPKA